MADEKSTYELILNELLQAIQGVVDDFGNPVTSPKTTLHFLRKLGWNVPVDTDFSGSSLSFISSLSSINLQPPIDYVNLLGTLKEIISKFESISGELNLGALLSEFESDFPRQLVDYTIMRQLEHEHPKVFTFLMLTGVFDNSYQPPNPPQRIGYTQYRIEWERLTKLLSEPTKLFETVYGWGTSDFNSKLLLEAIEYLLSALDIPLGEYNSNAGVFAKFNISERALYVPFVDQDELKAGIEIYSIPTDTTSDNAGIAVSPFLLGSAEAEIELNQNFTLVFRSSVKIDKTTGVQIRPKSDIEFFDLNAPSLKGAFEITIRARGEDKLVRIGGYTSSRLEVDAIEITGIARATESENESAVELSVIGGKIIFDMSAGDNFISSLVPAKPFEIPLDISIGYSNKRGAYFRGSAGFEIQLPIHLQLGPVSVDGVSIAIKVQDKKIPIEVGASFKGELGPLTMAIENVGFSVAFSLPDNTGGSLGLPDITFGFKPPVGVGLSIDTGVIIGGGFLYFNPDKGEYFGTLELSFQNVINLKAVGIINTRMPDGSKGFAFLVLVTAEFTPLQLGFGFTLNGVGGLLGLNRSTDIEALKTGVRTGAVSSIMFPEDVVGNITRIISDLTTVFPIVQAHFIVSPMGKIGWFTPPLITLELGIVLDIPSPSLVVLGVLRCILPDENTPILKLQVNFAGGIDFDKGLIWFDASLFDSSLLAYTLTGDMALRICWGNQAMFIVSVGGFHPSFHEIPADLTGMSRISIAMLSGDNPRLTAQTYFAVTSNSVQSGAKVELYAEACGFNVYGFLGYDLLVQFDPFHFIADIYAGLALRCDSEEIAGIDVHCELSGPTPWHALGDASITILFFSITVGFDETWGEEAPPQLVEPADVLQLLEDAVKDDRNWKAETPPNTNLSVSLRKIDALPGQIVVNPFGVLSVSQKVVPLDFTISKFGNKKPLDVTVFHITDGEGETADAEEEFAIGNFIELSDAEKLARKSFEPKKSGLIFRSSDTTMHGAEAEKEVDYELTYVHKKKQLFKKAGIFRLFASVFDVTVKGNAIHKSSYSMARKVATNAPAKVEVSRPAFTVVNTSDLQMCVGAQVCSSEAEAYMLHDSLISQDPSLEGAIQVVSNFELN